MVVPPLPASPDAPRQHESVGGGAYALSIDIGSRSAPDGWLTIVDGTMRGGDHEYVLAGVLKLAGGHITADVTVDFQPGVSGNSNISGPFTMRMIGSYENDRLELFGTGPLGIIVGMRGSKLP